MLTKKRKQNKIKEEQQRRLQRLKESQNGTQRKSMNQNVQSISIVLCKHCVYIHSVVYYCARLVQLVSESDPSPSLLNYSLLTTVSSHY